jgi:hypothetical protein
MGTAAQDFQHGLPIVLRRGAHLLGAGAASIVSSVLALLWIAAGLQAGVMIMTALGANWSASFSVWAWAACAYFGLGVAVMFVTHTIERGRKARLVAAEGNPGNGPDLPKEEVDQLLTDARTANVMTPPFPPESRS